MQPNTPDWIIRNVDIRYEMETVIDVSETIEI